LPGLFDEVFGIELGILILLLIIPVLLEFLDMPNSSGIKAFSEIDPPTIGTGLEVFVATLVVGF
jgi:hypothetical protein